MLRSADVETLKFGGNLGKPNSFDAGPTTAITLWGPTLLKIDLNLIFEFHVFGDLILKLLISMT